MAVRRILVTAISGDIANGILKILAENKNNELYGCDINEIAVGMDLVKCFWKCKFAVEEGFVNELFEKCIDHKISHLIVTNEREIEKVSKNIDMFYGVGIKVVIQAANVLNICLDKYETMEFLKSKDITVPRTYISAEKIVWDDRKRYILKPRKSNGSKGIRIINQKAFFSETDLKDCLLQEYIEGEEEYTVGIFRQKDVINTIAFRRYLKFGFSYRVNLIKNKEIEELARNIARIFSLEGFLNIQLIKRNNKLYIFEINPRISGTVRFRHMLGFKDVLWWLRLLEGDNIEQYRCPFDSAVGMRELNEKFLILKS